ncbi:MAG TPA: hypothetical protein PLE77_11930, partial [Kiritimatiellia bacterium]|nr:hypothetical protein [Kiritimatiellia bacterium]
EWEFIRATGLGQSASGLEERIRLSADVQAGHRIGLFAGGNHRLSLLRANSFRGKQNAAQKN